MRSRVKRRRPPRRPSTNTVRQFRRTFEEWGFPVLVVHMDRQIVCFCTYNAPGPDPHCSSCLGSGHAYSVEKHMTVEDVASVPETLARLIRQHEGGPIAVNARHFYFLPESQIKEQDFVAVTAFDRFGNPVSTYMTIYQVHHLNPYMTGEGRILALRASCTQDLVNNPIKSAFLRGDTYWPRYR